MEQARNYRHGRNKKNQHNKNAQGSQSQRTGDQVSAQPHQKQQNDGQRRNQRGGQNKQQNQPNTQRQQPQHKYSQPVFEPAVKPSFPVYTCPICSQPITELSSALADKDTGVPVHFDCVIEYLKEREELKQNERITYIGQGRFAVIYFENPHDLRKFNILRVIEWEKRESKIDWRSEIADCYSQVK